MKEIRLGVKLQFGIGIHKFVFGEESLKSSRLDQIQARSEAK